MVADEELDDEDNGVRDDGGGVGEHDESIEDESINRNSFKNKQFKILTKNTDFKIQKHTKTNKSYKKFQFDLH